MKHQEEKQLIYFKDLLFSALYQWRTAIVFGLVLAIIFGAVGFLMKENPVTTEPLSVTPETESKVQQLQASEERLQANIEYMETYMSSSVLMELNPYQCATAGFYLFVSTRDANAEDILLHAYRTSLEDKENMTTLAEQFQMTSVQFQELMVYNTDEAPIYHENCVYVAIRANTLEDAEKYRDAIQTVVLGYRDEIARSIGDHEVITYQVSSGPAVDFQLADLQNSARQRLSSLKTELTSTQTELNKYKPSVLESSDPNPVFFAVIGGILGVCIVFAFAWIKHIGSDKIYSVRVLENRTGITLLGAVRSTRKRCKIDLWLRKLEGRAQHTDLDAVAANIRNRCEGNTLLIMGNFEQSALSALTEKLESTGITCTLCDSPAVKADALNALPACDAVVLAETCSHSRYSDTLWAMQTVADHKKPLLGCVLIDG